MKRNFTCGVATLLLAMFFTTNFSSCSTDKCEGVTCQNGGTCESGDCNCTAGYEGANCQTKVNAKFEGSYNGIDDCNPTVTTTIDIAASNSAPAEIIIDVLDEQGQIEYEVIGDIYGSSIDIPNQSVVIGGAPVMKSGTGSLSGNTLTLSLTEDDNGNIISCNYSGNR